jgi:alanine dehydrogenase
VPRLVLLGGAHIDELELVCRHHLGDALGRQLAHYPHLSWSPQAVGAEAGSFAAAINPARAHGLIGGSLGSGGGAVSLRNCSIAAAIAAASSGEAAVWRSSIRGRTGRCFPFLGMAVKGYRRAVPEIPVFDHDSVLRAVSPLEAIERVREGFLEYAVGDWAMPPKLYLDAPPHGDFRAMPAKGDGLAILKWVTSFPDNPRGGLPVVMGLICVSSATDGRPLALVDARATTALRTGAVAAVAAQELAREDARSVGIVGCGLHGSWAARCLAAAEYGPGVCFDPDPEAAGGLAGELGWEAGGLEDSLACDVVTCVTPGAEPVVRRADLRPGMHLNALGADGPGKAELEVEAVARCKLFCDEWQQASHGGELTGAVERGLVDRDRVTELGDVLSGAAPGRSGPEAITLFDSTGLAIQDLAICRAVLEAQRAGGIRPQRLRL